MTSAALGALHFPIRPMGGFMSVSARVLVVEDDLANQQSLSALLAQMGHIPTVADRGDEALRLLDTEVDLDVIISDDSH